MQVRIQLRGVCLRKDIVSDNQQIQSHTHPRSLGSGNVVDVAFGKGLFTSLPIFCFAFNCQVQFLPIVAELKGGRSENGKTKVTCLIFGVMCGVCGLYCLDASVGYLR